MNTIQKPWNGYTITNRGVNALFQFSCRNCNHKRTEVFKDTTELLLFRLEWRNHVETHGGPYA